MPTVTRSDLSEAVRRAAGLPHRESMRLVDSILYIVSERLSAGETVKISSFGKFTVRGKAERVGRNPRTGEEHLVSARRVIAFRASPRMRERIGRAIAGNSHGAARR